MRKGANFLIGVVALAQACAWAEVQYVKQMPCHRYDPKLAPTESDRPKFTAMWSAVTGDEAGLKYAFAKGDQSRTDADVQNRWMDRCSFEMPAETIDTKVIYRRITFDQDWSKTVQIDPSTTSVRKEHHGFRFEYKFDTRSKETKLLSMEVCRDAEGCKAIGFKTAVSAAQPVKFDLAEDCNDHQGYGQIWPKIENLETVKFDKDRSPIERSALTEILEKSRVESGKNAPTSCKVYLPDPNRQQLNPLITDRRFVQYRLWTEIVDVHGNEFESLGMNGLRVDLREHCSENEDGSLTCRTKVLNYSVCRTEATCEIIGVTAADVDKQRVTRNFLRPIPSNTTTGIRPVIR